MKRYKLFREFFFIKWNFYFKLSIFVERLSNFISYLDQFYFKFVSNPELPGSGSGSGMIFPPYPDPAKSFGSDRTRIRPDPDPFPDPQHCLKVYFLNPDHDARYHLWLMLRKISTDVTSSGSWCEQSATPSTASYQPAVSSLIGTTYCLTYF